MVVSPPVAVPVVAVSPPVAEPGPTTSEWRLILGALAGNIVALAVAFGLRLSSEQQTALVACLTSVTVLVASYAVSRGLRKAGTGG